MYVILGLKIMSPTLGHGSQQVVYLVELWTREAGSVDFSILLSCGKSFKNIEVMQRHSYASVIFFMPELYCM